MNERIHRALDGELPKDALSRHEAEEFAQTRNLIHRVLYAAPDEAMPDLSAAILTRIRPRTSRSVFAWFWIPRPVSFPWRPAYGFGLAAILLFIAVAVFQPTSIPTPQVLVQFRLDAPNARNVALAGEFTNWKPAYALKRSEPGVWTVVVPLEPGVHDYGFVIDGERWSPDPMAPAVDDGFGGLNSRVAVLIPDAGRSSL
jgi:hypothetical protein